MNSDQIAGTAKRMAGKVEESLGSAVGDAKSRVQGLARQAEGTAQELYSQAKIQWLTQHPLRRTRRRKRARLLAKAHRTWRSMCATPSSIAHTPRC